MTISCYPIILKRAFKPKDQLRTFFFFLTENEHNKLGKLAGMTNGFSWIGSYPNSHKKFLKDFLKNTYAMERVFCKKILGIGLFFLL